MVIMLVFPHPAPPTKSVGQTRSVKHPHVRQETAVLSMFRPEQRMRHAMMMLGAMVLLASVMVQEAAALRRGWVVHQVLQAHVVLAGKNPSGIQPALPAAEQTNVGMVQVVDQAVIQ
jgi:hypothetical protein